jgi:hypothetical protein
MDIGGMVGELVLIPFRQNGFLDLIHDHKIVPAG